mmetsp:Transcript_50430/g.117642  ORF Transcript_50430/g.117642 Transcript_50430/m.117642 type:complete len:204 (+) Transcript_50430:395-1006(+)
MSGKARPISCSLKERAKARARRVTRGQRAREESLVRSERMPSPWRGRHPLERDPAPARVASRREKANLADEAREDHQAALLREAEDPVDRRVTDPKVAAAKEKEMMRKGIQACARRQAEMAREQAADQASEAVEMVAKAVASRRWVEWEVATVRFLLQVLLGHRLRPIVPVSKCLRPISSSNRYHSPRFSRSLAWVQVRVASH